MQLFDCLSILVFFPGLNQVLALSQLVDTSSLPESLAGLPSSSEIISHALENSQSGLCCAALSLVLDNKVSYPNQTQYTGSLGSYWSAQERSTSPKCIVEPRSAKDVSSAVFVLSLLSTRTGFTDACKFALRSGGHTPWSGSANIEGGVTIDMKFVNQVDVSPDQTVTSVGPGNRWVDVYLKLDAMGLAVPGGRVADVGVGGLTLGGGVSFFAARYGFLCDNVLNYELVLPYGKIINANKTSYPDLFHSLKGGSNNFGVVTRFDIKTFKQGKFWGGAVAYDISSREQHFRAFENLATATPYDPYAALINNYGYAAAAGGWFIANDYEYTKQPAEPYPATFAPFTSIKPELQNTMRVSNMSDFSIELGQATPEGQRWLFRTLTHGPSASLLSTIFDLLNTTYQPILHTPNLILALTIQPIPTAITSIAASTGGNTLGLSANSGNLALTLLTVGWTDKADDAAIDAAASAWLAASKAASVKAGSASEFLYLNYADQTQDVITGYGEGNRRELRRVSRVYDPEGVFQKAVVGGFKLF